MIRNIIPLALLQGLGVTFDAVPTNRKLAKVCYVEILKGTAFLGKKDVAWLYSFVLYPSFYLEYEYDSREAAAIL